MTDDWKSVSAEDRKLVRPELLKYSFAKIDWMCRVWNLQLTYDERRIVFEL